MTTKRDMWRVTSDEIPAGLRVRHSCHASPVTRHPQQGMALVITLILLSVTLIMAVAFLSVSRREREAVTTTTDSASARLAADAALANAEAQIVANIFATTNSAAYNFGLLVSTNFPPLNYTNSPDVFTNLFVLPRAPVYLSNLVTHAMENRFYLDLNRNGLDDPNGFVTNVDQNGNFILDSSRNPIINFQIGDPEWIGLLDRPDVPHGPNNRFVARYAFIAVPVGNTLDINAIHNQTLNRNLDPTKDGYFRNQGVGSWEINLAAFLTDLNTNQWDPFLNNYDYETWNGGLNSGYAFSDAFALLTNRYAANYNSLASVNGLYGIAGPGHFAFLNDNIDGYSDGPLQMTFNTNEFFIADNPQLPWAGADNTNQFFMAEELFNTNETAAFGIHLLNAGTNTFAGSTVPTYDRYTFYRMLGELGSDSTPESGKMNVNYDNLDPFVTVVGGNTITNAPASTNFMAWQPLSFFTNAADRLLRLYTTNWFRTNPSNYLFTYYGIATNYYYANSSGNFVTNDPNGLGLTNIPFFGITNQVPAFGITNIPVWANGQLVYTPAVNRLLQLAANIYDATTNSFYPSIFRPIFEHDNFGNVFITGYTTLSSASGLNTVSGLDDPQLATPYDVLQLFTFPANLPITDAANGYVNVYGVPWIIGAKKGLPNFNEFSFESMAMVTRKLEITRPSIDAPLSNYQTNQMYILSITNQLGVECWNSYSSNYASSSQIQIMTRDSLSMMLTNLESSGATMPPVTFFTSPYVMSGTVSLPLQAGLYTWPGSAPWRITQRNGSPSPSAISFDIPLTTNTFLLTNSIYRYSTHQFIPAEDPATTNYVDKDIFPLPQFGLLTTNRLQVVMLDGNHVIDYVQFAGPDSSRNLNAEIADYDPNNPNIGLWNTNYFGGGTVPNGVVNQIYYALNPQQNTNLLTGNDDRTWRNPPGGGTVGQEIASLNAFLNPNHVGSGTDPNTGNSYTTSNLDLAVQVGFTPARGTYQYISWQANDPLVHYLAGDLNYSGAEPGGLQTGTHQSDNAWTINWPPNNLGSLNDRYQPWGRILSIPNTDNNAYNLAYKDPLVRMSDNWDFPTNKLPGIGWLGRVHRGTPWQSIYLKASDVLREIQVLGRTVNQIGDNTWAQWTGDTQLTYNQYIDAENSAPKQDRLLFDVFTTAFNANATRGQLSVNQPHLAAWSALFSGLVVLSNSAPDSLRMSLLPQYQNPPPIFTNMVIQPAGSALTTNSPMWQLWNGITQSRAVVTNSDGVVGAFEHAGDILLVPQFTQQSPFLKVITNGVVDGVQQTNGISDEMYEWLPQQVMSLLRDGPPRYVIYCYGQALKPAPDSLVTSGATFGMCTNYQVVAESAARAVVRVEGANTSAPHVVVESFNPLPPD
jgi:hypothetical protein